MLPGQYTELYFPRRSDRARSEEKTTERIDKLLHAERVDARHQKRPWSARLAPLADACMVVSLGARDACLVGRVRCMLGPRRVRVPTVTCARYRNRGAHGTLGGEDSR